MNNFVQLIGRIGNDLQLKYTQNKMAVLGLRLAVQENKTKTQQAAKETQWFNVVVFGGWAENLSGKAKKGAKILIMGKLNARQWTDKNGVVKNEVEVLTNQVYLIDETKRDQVQQLETSDDIVL